MGVGNGQEYRLFFVGYASTITFFHHNGVFFFTWGRLGGREEGTVFGCIGGLRCPVGVGRYSPRTTDLVVSRCNNPGKRLKTSLECLSRECSVPLPRLGNLLASVNARRLNRLRVVNAVIRRLAGGLARGRVRRGPNFTTCFISRATNICPTTTDNFP